MKSRHSRTNTRNPFKRHLRQKIQIFKGVLRAFSSFRPISFLQECMLPAGSNFLIHLKMLWQNILLIASAVVGVLGIPNPSKSSGSKKASHKRHHSRHYQPKLTYKLYHNSAVLSKVPLESGKLRKTSIDHVVSKVFGVDASGYNITGR